MALPEGAQFGRRVSLLLVEGTKALDLSEMWFTFTTVQDDEESPANCAIRVFNLSEDTVKSIKGEYSRVVLQAGYGPSSFGVIFDGTIKQFRTGKEPAGLNTYLDLLVADGDIGYNYGVCSRTLAAGSSPANRINAALEAMSPYGIKPGNQGFPGTGGTLPRGKVLFGLARGILRAETQSLGCTWSIQEGRVNILPLTGYLPGEAVVLTARTGLIGRVEQTADGMRARCLLNPKIGIGNLVRIDNASINTTEAQSNAAIAGGQLAYDKYAGFQQFASIAADGLYRAYVVEHTGNTRGTDFYTDIVGLTVDPVTMKVKAYG